MPEEVVTQIVLAMLKDVVEVAKKYKDGMTPEDQQRIAEAEDGMNAIRVE